MEVYARAKVLELGDEMDELICSETPSLNRNDLRNSNQETLSNLIMDCAAFSSSF